MDIRFLLLAIFALPLYVSAQIHFNFEESGLEGWYNDILYFTTDRGELRSSGPPESSIISISRPNPVFHNYSWTFFTRMDFNPSVSNHCRFYLISDSYNLESPLNGYYVKIGGVTGNLDAVELYRQNGTIHTKLISGIPGSAGKEINKLNIRINYYQNGIWELFTDTTGRGIFFSEGQVMDYFQPDNSFFGIYCTHTSTRNDKFFFDNITVSSAPAKVLQVEATHINNLNITFSDPAVELKHANIEINGLRVESEFIISEFQTFIPLDKPLNSSLNAVKISGVSDSRGENIPDTTFFVQFTPVLSYGSIIINEVYPDPSPSRGLPEYEFIELFNRTADTLSLKGFSLSDPLTKSTLPEAIILPGSYLILTAARTVHLFQEYGPVVGLEPWPSLNNSSDILTLKDHNDRIIFDLYYSDTWFKSSASKNGGWSLEMINPEAYCKKESNWSETIDPAGGTPGRKNSVYSEISDLSGPVIQNVMALNEETVLMQFSEPLKSGSNVRCLINGAEAKLQLFENKDSATIDPPFILTRGNYYVITTFNLYDCLENRTNESVFEYFYPDNADSGDIVINEILFNPWPYGVDFVEIFNRSNKSCTLKDWALGSIKDSITEVSTPFPEIILSPGEFYVFTINLSTLKEHYPLTISEKVLELAKMPAYRDESGTVLLLNKNRIMDRLDYFEDQHSNLLSSKEGVSLERISPTQKTNNPHNWHSAASIYNATPGFRNSQYRNLADEKEKTVYADPAVFSPDLDGIDDFTTIHLRPEAEGFIGKVFIFDIKGRLIRRLMENNLLGSVTTVIWDGTDDEGLKASTGIYLLFAEMYNNKGEVITVNETVVIGTRF